jgi:hypothetical protein
MFRSLAFAAALTLAPGLTLALNPQPAPPDAPPPALAPPAAQVSPPEQIAPGPNNPGTSGTEGMSPGRSGTMSEHLSRQEGALQPTDVDPGIRAPVPPGAQGTMPVIPPPGSPGGDQRVIPK